VTLSIAAEDLDENQGPYETEIFYLVDPSDLAGVLTPDVVESGMVAAYWHPNDNAYWSSGDVDGQPVWEALPFDILYSLDGGVTVAEMQLHYAYGSNYFAFDIFTGDNLTADEINTLKLEFAGDSLKIVGIPPAATNSVELGMPYGELMNALQRK